MLVLILSVLATVFAVGALAKAIAENIGSVLSGAASLFTGTSAEGVLLGVVIGFTAVYFLRKSRMSRRARAEGNAAKADGTDETAPAETAAARRVNGRA